VANEDVSNNGETNLESAPDTYEQLTRHELRLLMELAIAQIAAALKEAKSGTEALGRDLTTIGRQTKGGGAATAALAQLQFFDKLSQRLEHACAGLEVPVRMLAGAAPEHSPGWRNVANEIRNLYTTSDEQVIFDFFFGGFRADNFQQALGAMLNSARSGDLDLF
jgi:hypothetical protein